MLFVTFRHPGLDTPILIPFRAHADMNPQAIMLYIMKVVQSNQNFSIDEEMVWRCTRIGAQQGEGPGLPASQVSPGQLGGVAE